MVLLAIGYVGYVGYVCCLLFDLLLLNVWWISGLLHNSVAVACIL